MNRAFYGQVTDRNPKLNARTPTYIAKGFSSRMEAVLCCCNCRFFVGLTNAFLCIDPGFLLEKAGKAFCWTLHHANPRGQRTHLPGYRASVVDANAQWHAAQTCQGAGHPPPGPHFTRGGEAADLLFQEGDRLLLFEIKASTLATIHHRVRDHAR